MGKVTFLRSPQTYGEHQETLLSVDHLIKLIQDAVLPPVAQKAHKVTYKTKFKRKLGSMTFYSLTEH